MEEVWGRGQASGRDVHAALEGALAYTTLVTTLDRLYRKGFLDRRKEGRAHVYSARLSREELETSLVRQIITGSLEGQVSEARPLLSCIVEAVSDRDRLLLDDLERLIREKRRDVARRSRR